MGDTDIAPRPVPPSPEGSGSGNVLGRDKRPALLPAIQAVGQAANRVAARHAFSDYISRLAPNTRRRHSADLFLFADFLASVGIQTDELMDAADEWAAVTWGLVKAFVEWMLQEGYALGSVNVRLSTVRTYARLAVDAGSLAQLEYDRIAKIRSYNRMEARHIDEQRPVTRIGVLVAKGRKRMFRESQIGVVAGQIGPDCPPSQSETCHTG